MLNQETLTNQVAAYKKDARRHFDKAVAALLTLAWPYKSEDFTFNESFPKYGKAIETCINLSDDCIKSARKRLAQIIESIEMDSGTLDEVYDEDAEVRMDMAGSHLLELLAVWIGVAVANGWTKTYTEVMISRYLSNPFLCPDWKNIPLDALSWGRGYARDIAEQLAVIGQGIIIEGAREADRMKEQDEGALYYIRMRGSGFICPECDSLCGKRIQIDTPFEIPHPRCMCYPEYFYEQI